MEIFENGDLSYLCGRAKIEVLKYDDVMPRFQACLRTYDLKTVRVDADIFKYGGKSLRFEKYPATVHVDGQIRFETSVRIV